MKTDQIRVIAAEDRDITLLGIEALIGKHENMSLVATAKSGEECMEALKKHPCDVLLADIDIPRPNGLELVDFVRKEYPHIWIVLFTGHMGVFVHEIIALENVSYVAKRPDNRDDIIKAIEWGHSGRVYFDQQALLEEMHRNHLLAKFGVTPKELAVIRICNRDNDTICNTLDMELGNLQKNHLSNIYRKLKIPGRQALIRWAEHNCFLKPE